MPLYDELRHQDLEASLARLDALERPAGMDADNTRHYAEDHAAEDKNRARG